MVRKILAAVDSTERAREVIRAAAEIAHRFGATVFLFRVVEPPQELPPAAATHPDGVDEFVRAQAREELVKLAGDDPALVVAPPELSHVEPWHGILAAAQRMDVDWIVIGRHAYRGWDRILGTTTTRVVNHADRHVLVVHEPDGR